MKYNNLKDSVIEVLNNDKILKNNLIMEYKLPKKEFSALYMEFIADNGGEVKENLSFFEINIEFDFKIKITLDE